MKVAIMQPYFLPYIGYWQLLNAVDVFVIYDNIKYTKKGWINRNRFLLNGKDEFFTLPLRSDSDSLDINQRVLAADFDRSKLVNKLENAYKKAVHSDVNLLQVLLHSIPYTDSVNLFDYIFSSIQSVAKTLDIKTPIIKSSDLPFDHRQFKGQDKVISICEHLKATEYINPIGGTELYNGFDFFNKGIALKFLKSRPIAYPQTSDGFVEWLSIVDVLMNRGVSATKNMLSEYDLV